MDKLWRCYCLKYGVQSTECWPEQFKGTDCVLCNKGWGRLCVVANTVGRWGLCSSGMFSSIAWYLVADISGQLIGLIFRGPDSLLQYVYNYQVMLCNILDERRPRPHHCESLKSHTADRAWGISSGRFISHARRELQISQTTIWKILHFWQARSPMMLCHVTW